MSARTAKPCSGRVKGQLIDKAAYKLPVDEPDAQNLIDPSDYCVLTVYTIFPPFSTIMIWVSFCK